jgi:uncharacterized protein YaaQ
MKSEIPASQTVNQLIFATVAGSQASEFIERLTHDDFHVTQIDSRGGILHEATVSLLIGLDRTQLPLLLELFREYCRRRRKFIPAHTEAPFIEAPTVMIEAEIGGATIYAFNVERFEQL